MKKSTLFLFALAFFLLQQASAQNTSPYWSLAGNSNASNTSSKLGTTNSVNLRFYTKNVERLRLDTLGHIGINMLPVTDAQVEINSASNIRPMRLLVNKSIRFLFHYNGGLTIGNGTAPPAQGLYVAGSVGIGTATPVSGYKMDVEGGSSTTTVYANNTYAYGIGVYGNSSYLGVYGEGLTYGLKGDGTSSSSYGVLGRGGAYGVYGLSLNSGYGIFGNSSTTYSSNGSTGVYGQGYYGVQGQGGTYGVYGTSGSYGVYGISNGGNAVWGNTSSGYAVVGNATSGDGGYFISATGFALVAKTSNSAGNWAGVFYGNVYTSGTYQTSDRRLKKNITEFNDATTIINQLKPRTYEFKSEGKMAEMNLPKGKHYGLIAQDVEAVLPNLVKEVNENAPAPDHNAPLTANTTAIVPQDPTQKMASPAQPQQAPNNSTEPRKEDEPMIKAVNYIELIPIMIKAMQEQQAQIEVLKKKAAEVDALKQELDALKAAVEARSGNSLTYNSAYLEQNTPNPVSGSTTIRYHLPTNTTSAVLNVTNAKGQLVKTMALNNGAGQVNLNTNALASGTYNYTLYLNGQPVETKRLVIAR